MLATVFQSVVECLNLHLRKDTILPLPLNSREERNIDTSGKLVLLQVNDGVFQDKEQEPSDLELWPQPSIETGVRQYFNGMTTPVGSVRLEVDSCTQIILNPIDCFPNSYSP